MQPNLILFLASNPATTNVLALDEEARDIETKMRAAEQRNAFSLKTKWAVRPDDLLQALNEHQPVIVHFSGHGDGVPGIVLNDDAGGEKLVTGDALKHLFVALKDHVRVVVLNACHSAEQARAIAEVIDCVIGMNDEIDDVAARKFAASFYRALGFGRSVQNAFDQGIAAIKLEGLADHGVPELLVRAGVTASEVRLVRLPDELPVAPSDGAVPTGNGKRVTIKRAVIVTVLTLSVGGGVCVSLRPDREQAAVASADGSDVEGERRLGPSANGHDGSVLPADTATAVAVPPPEPDGGEHPTDSKRVRPKVPAAPKGTNEGGGNVSVSSVNQSGGITAQNVTIHNAPKQRVVEQKAGERMVEYLRRAPTRLATNISYISGDLESDRLATQLAAVLTDAGWDSDLTAAINGNIKPGIEIVSRPADSAAARHLAAALSNGGMRVSRRTDESAAADQLNLVVGPMPRTP